MEIRPSRRRRPAVEFLQHAVAGLHAVNRLSAARVEDQAAATAAADVRRSKRAAKFQAAVVTAVNGGA